MSARRAGLRGRRGAAQPTPQDPVSVENIVQALAPAMAALRPPSSRVPASAAPEKCKLEMSVGEFKAWKCSMEWWLNLNKWVPSEAVGHIRLLCSPPLQRAMDARFSVAQWSVLTIAEALEAIKRIVLQPKNRAAVWSKFFCDNQKDSENISAYFTRCAQDAVECEFQCPNCACDLGDYFLLGKLIVGLSDTTLKREVYRICDSFTLDSLRIFCGAYESTKRVQVSSGSSEYGYGVATCAGGGGGVGPPLVSAGDATAADDVTAAAAAAAATPSAHHRRPPPRPDRSNSKPKAQQCGNCGRMHGPRWDLCPARNITCDYCGKVGHYERMCRSKLSGGKVSGAVMVAASNSATPPQPTILVNISHSTLPQAIKVNANADTGAQVCVAGTELLNKLHLKPSKLNHRTGLRDVANRALTPLGSFTCEIELNNRTITQDIYFVRSAKGCYLSLSACKKFGLVNESFPQPMTTTTVAPVEFTAAPPLVMPTKATQPPHSGPPENTPEHSGPLKVTPNNLPVKPTEMPFAPLEENIGRLEMWLLQHFSNATFNTKKIPFPVMEGAPHHIHLKPDAKPYACQVPADIPRHWESEVKQMIDNDVANSVIKQVPQGEVTEWCARMVVPGKKDGHPRRAVDYQKLNASSLRETHYIPTPFDLVSNVPQHSYKTTADAASGFHQVELDDDSIKLTTFITKWGRYQ